MLISPLVSFRIRACSGNKLAFWYGSFLQLEASQKLKDSLRFLYTNGRLNRFVVDEAHCVSQVRKSVVQFQTPVRTWRCVSHSSSLAFVFSFCLYIMTCSFLHLLSAFIASCHSFLYTEVCI